MIGNFNYSSAPFSKTFLETTLCITCLNPMPSLCNNRTLLLKKDDCSELEKYSNVHGTRGLFLLASKVESRIKYHAPIFSRNVVLNFISDFELLFPLMSNIFYTDQAFAEARHFFCPEAHRVA